MAPSTHHRGAQVPLTCGPDPSAQQWRIPGARSHEKGAPSRPTLAPETREELGGDGPGASILTHAKGPLPDAHIWKQRAGSLQRPGEPQPMHPARCAPH